MRVSNGKSLADSTQFFANKRDLTQVFANKRGNAHLRVIQGGLGEQPLTTPQFSGLQSRFGFVPAPTHKVMSTSRFFAARFPAHDALMQGARITPQAPRIFMKWPAVEQAANDTNISLPDFVAKQDIEATWPALTAFITAPVELPTRLLPNTNIVWASAQGDAPALPAHVQADTPFIWPATQGDAPTLPANVQADTPFTWAATQGTAPTLPTFVAKQDIETTWPAIGAFITAPIELSTDIQPDKKLVWVSAQGDAPVLPTNVQTDTPFVWNAAQGNAPVLPVNVQADTPFIWPAAQSTAPVLPTSVAKQDIKATWPAIGAFITAPIELSTDIQPDRKLIWVSTQGNAPVLPAHVQADAPFSWAAAQGTAPILPANIQADQKFNWEAAQGDAPTLPANVQADTPFIWPAAQSTAPVLPTSVAKQDIKATWPAIGAFITAPIELSTDIQPDKNMVWTSAQGDAPTLPANVQADTPFSWAAAQDKAPTLPENVQADQKFNWLTAKAANDTGTTTSALLAPNALTTQLPQTNDITVMPDTSFAVSAPAMKATGVTVAPLPTITADFKANADAPKKKLSLSNTVNNVAVAPAAKKKTLSLASTTASPAPQAAKATLSLKAKPAARRSTLSLGGSKKAINPVLAEAFAANKKDTLSVPKARTITPVRKKPVSTRNMTPKDRFKAELQHAQQRVQDLGGIQAAFDEPATGSRYAKRSWADLKAEANSKAVKPAKDFGDIGGAFKAELAKQGTENGLSAQSGAAFNPAPRPVVTPTTTLRRQVPQARKLSNAA